MENRAPESNEIEITIFGPGIGEAIAVHLGNNEWLLVDSCRVGNNQKAASLEYLETIGVDPAQAVRLIVATHWHNDHIKGLSQIVENSRSAKFVCPQVLTNKEFLKLIELQNADSSFMSDTSEFDAIINHFARIGALTDRNNHPFLYGTANKRLLYRKAAREVCACEVYSLSPSDKATALWHNMLAAALAPNQPFRKRITPPSPNQISVALWITVGATQILLGADLEETGNGVGGWKVIVESNERPDAKASVNKVAHHGSENGHYPDVWSRMLEPNPVALVAPYNSGRKKLPSLDDVTRIIRLTNRAFITSPLRDRTFRGKTGSVNRTINEVARRIRTADAEEGYIRIRKSADDASDKWRIELFGKALPLSSVQAEGSNFPS